LRWLCRYVGYALTTQWEGQEASKLQMIGFDMGGTSTDVSRFAGSYEHVFESTTAGLLHHIFSSLASLPCPEAARPRKSEFAARY
jgi:N-methylhydantoinase A/oxoprolinase/acetone carboxylase beta subunit